GMCFTPPDTSKSWRANRARHQGGTASSNPVCSSSESSANRLPKLWSAPNAGRAKLSLPPLEDARDRGFAESPLEESGFELVWGFSCQVVILVSRRFFVRGCVQVRPACS